MEPQRDQMMSLIPNSVMFCLVFLGVVVAYSMPLEKEARPDPLGMAAHMVAMEAAGVSSELSGRFLEEAVQIL